jgi:hypothetical protein
VEPVELTVSDGEETYRLTARRTPAGWVASLWQPLGDGVARQVWPVGLQAVADGGPYPTPDACLAALFRAVATELFGLVEGAERRTDGDNGTE